MIRLPFPRNPFSLAGAILATGSAVLFLIVFFLDVLGLHTNPYLGMLFFLVFPALFVAGLLIIPIGAWRDRRRRLAGKPEFHWPHIDLNDARQRSFAFFIVAITMVNIIIVSLAAYSGVEYMDSTSFCGQVCHTVMEPEFVAHEQGAHSRVTCVQCHIGPGAPWFVKSKLDGARQVWATALGTYSHPIKSPVHNLRPAREVCEQCHWPEKFHGDLVRVVHDYAEDEANTESTTTLRVHVGGGSDRLGTATGIHWHMNLANQIEYKATDDKRQVIPWVRLKDRFGNVREYQAEGVTPEDLAKAEPRIMDCVDCHNRPAHPLDPTADKAVNRALATNEMPKDLPFIKREATAALKETYPSQTAAIDAIDARLREFYRKQFPQVYMGRRQDVERAVKATEELYRRNIFPTMNITWGTYVNNIGHMDFPGCFRCHDGSHTTKDGKTIGQACDLCHTMQ
jgi:hypothetical protein